MSSETEQSNPRDDASSEVTEESARTDEGLFPITSKQYEIGLYLFLSGWLIYMFVQIQQFSHTADVLFPTILFALGAPLIAIKLITIQCPGIVDRLLPNQKSAQGTVESKLGSDNIQRTRKEREKVELLMAFWIVLLPFFMYYIGLGWAIFVYSFSFSMFFIKDLKTSVINTIVIVGLAYVLFVKVLGILIWEGQLRLFRDLFFYLNLIF